MKASRKVIITCAVTGSVHTPSMSPYLPWKPEDIASQAIEAAQAGASILHLHAREVVVPLYKNRPPVRVTAPVPLHMYQALRACGWEGEVFGLVE